MKFRTVGSRRFNPFLLLEGIVLVLALGLSMPTWAQKPPKATVLSAQQYRAQLETASRQMEAIENHRPRPLGPILDRLDTAVTVRRADGQKQSVEGNTWSNFKRDLSKAKDSKRTEVVKARQMVLAQIQALDEWTAKPSYTSADAQKVIASLEKTKQARTGPLWWQKMLSDAWKSVGKAWDAVINWINSWLPKPTAPKSLSAPNVDDRWLWMLFYVFVAAILAVVLWYVIRIFGGGWKWGSRTSRRQAELEGEDAQLLLLPPAELRSRADEYAAQGNFREALRHRYLALLVQLDARGVWRYDSRRTNWEHIAALRRQENKHALVSPLSELTRRFDRVRYGGAPCDAEHWQQFDGDARQFEKESSQFEVAGRAR